jgi:hypothetical protein
MKKTNKVHPLTFFRESNEKRKAAYKKGGYAEQLINLIPEKLKEHIVLDQMKKNKLSEGEAIYLADTLIDGNKKVIDGQYAILYKGYAENIEDESDYYIRKNNKWILDKNISKKDGITDETSLLCDLQKKCISNPTKIDDNCESMKVNELSLQNNLLNNIISEFDEKYRTSKQEFERHIKDKFDALCFILLLLIATFSLPIKFVETNFHD